MTDDTNDALAARYERERQVFLRLEPAGDGLCGDWRQPFCQRLAAYREITQWCGIGQEYAFYRCREHLSDAGRAALEASAAERKTR